MSKHSRCLLCIFALFAFSAQSAVITFTSPGVSDGEGLPQTYGDSLNVDVQYFGRTGSGNSSLLDMLRYWTSGYDGTTEVAFAPEFGVGEIFLQPAQGFQIVLNSFDLTSYLAYPSNTEFRILDGGFNVLASSGPLNVSTLQTFTFNIVSTTGIRIQFGPEAYTVGIDNIDFAVTETPEPGTLALLGAAFAVGLCRMGWGQLRRAGS